MLDGAVPASGVQDFCDEDVAARRYSGFREREQPPQERWRRFSRTGLPIYR